MRASCFRYGLLLTALSLVIYPAVCSGQEMPRIAILPFANYTGQALAADVIIPAIEQLLSALPVDLADHTETREVLRKFRIRAVGGLDRFGADALAEGLGIDYVLTGSYDVYAPGNVPEIAFSMRLIDVRTLRIIWASSTGMTGTDKVLLLGLGRIATIDDLAARITNERASSLASAIDRLGMQEDGSERLAVVAFDDLTPESGGGRIVTSLMTTELVQRGFHVIDPGAVNAVCLSFGRVPRGGVDFELLTALRDSLGIARVVTGSVDLFRMSDPDTEESYPEISFMGRLLDVPSLSIDAIADVSRDGRRGGLFGLGGTRSSSKLIQSVSASLLDRLGLKEGTHVSAP